MHPIIKNNIKKNSLLLFIVSKNDKHLIMHKSTHHYTYNKTWDFLKKLPEQGYHSLKFKINMFKKTVLEAWNLF